jgi:hypothetical protein
MYCNITCSAHTEALDKWHKRTPGAVVSFMYRIHSYWQMHVQNALNISITVVHRGESCLVGEEVNSSLGDFLLCMLQKAVG